MKLGKVVRLLMVMLVVIVLCGCGLEERKNSPEAQMDTEIQREEREGEVQEIEDQEERKEVWLPITEITVNSRGSYREFALEYDSQGFLVGGTEWVSTETSEKEDAESYILKITCDENGRPIEKVMEKEDGSSSTVQYSYDEEGMLASINGGGFRSYFTYEYDTEGRVSTRTHLGADGSSVSGYRVFTYDDEGNVVGQTLLMADGQENDRYSYTMAYEYEENGLLCRKQMYCGSELIFDTTYTYELFSVPESFDETQPYAVTYIDSSITY